MGLVFFNILIPTPNGSYQEKLCLRVRGLSLSYCWDLLSRCLPPTWTLLFQPDQVLPATSWYSLPHQSLHLEIWRQINPLTSQISSVSACVLNNKAIGSFFKAFFFTFTSLISMVNCTDQPQWGSSVSHCHWFSSWITKPHTCYDTFSTPFPWGWTALS